MPTLADLKMMDIDELLLTRASTQSTLAAIQTEILVRIENRRRQIMAAIELNAPAPAPEALPRINGVPKYRNPANPAQTWTGRGKTPAWITGLKKEDCRIPA